jgi:hypothetical protein
MIGSGSPLSRRARAAIAVRGAGAGMHVRRVSVAPEDVVFVKGILEASEGVAAMFAEHGGELLLAAPHERAADLDELLTDLARDVGARVAPTDEPAPVAEDLAP